MKRLIPFLLLTLTTCQPAHAMADRRKQTDPGPATSATLNLNTGEYTTDYSGQVRAGGGSVSSTDDGSIPALAKNIGDKEFTYASARLSLKDEPNVNEIASLENQHKDAVGNLAKFSPGTDPYTAAFNTVQSLGKQIFDYKKAKESRAKADEGAIDMRVLSVGAGHQLAPMRAAESFENVLKSRHVNPSLYSRTTTEKQTEISSTNDYAGVNAVLKTQLEMTKLELEIARLKNAVTPTKPAPVGKPPEVEVEGDDTSVLPDEPTSSVEYDKLPKKNFIYKTRLEKHNPVTRHDAAILIPKDRPAPVSIDGIGHEIVENYLSKSEDRWLLRTKGPLTGSAATLVVTYKDGSKETFKIKALNSRTEYAPGAFKKSDTGPVDPTPSGDTSKAPAGGKTHELTPIGLLLRADVAATVSHVIVIEDAETNRENPPKIAATRIGNTWTTGKPLSQHRAAVYQVWFATPPPAPVTYHPDFLGRGPVGHVTQAGLWNPDTIR